MSATLVALVFMGNPEDNFFIENAPEGNPVYWIERFVHDFDEVESVDVFRKGDHHAYWSNPNCCPEK